MDFTSGLYPTAVTIKRITEAELAKKLRAQYIQTP